MCIRDRLSLVPRLFRRALFPDVVLLHTSAPVNGKVSMGIEVNVLPGAVEACKHRGGLVIAQVNPRMPYTFGDGEIAVEDLDAMIHVDSPVAMPARTDAPVDEVWPDMEPAVTAAKDRLFRLARAIESDVIPRLVQAHRATEALLPVAPKPTEADVRTIAQAIVCGRSTTAPRCAAFRYRPNSSVPPRIDTRC